MSKAIVLAHGLFMKKQIMLYLQKKFKDEGFVVYNFDYETLKFHDQTLKDFHDFVEKIEEDEVYFVGHSMGGLLMRLYLEIYKPKFKDSCLVTIGTPHKGSSLGRLVADSPLGFILGSAPNSGVTQGLGDWKGEYPIGCIVGVLNVGPNIIFNNGKGQGDGTVLKKEAFVENANDIIELNVNHTGMVYSSQVMKQTLEFIKNKEFKRLTEKDLFLEEHQNLFKKFEDDVMKKANQIDPENIHSWRTLAYGWALAFELTPEDANKFAEYLEF